MGGIPIITKFAARQYSNEIRLEAAAFVRQMYQTSTLTLQMFVSAGGLNVLVEFLDEDYDASRDLVLIGVNGIWNVFELQGPTPKNDFCRIFSRSKILDPLALVLHKVLDEDDKDELTELIEGRIVNIFYLFSQAENYVKEVVAERQVLKSESHQTIRMEVVVYAPFPPTMKEPASHADRLLVHSCSQGPPPDVTTPPNHYAQVYQELVHAVANTRVASLGRCYRLFDRLAGL